MTASTPSTAPSSLPAGTPATRSTSPSELTADQLAGIRAQLVRERAEVLASVAALAGDAEQLSERQASGQERIRSSGDADDVAVERHLVGQLSASAQASLAEIEAAIARLAAGTFGSCGRCAQHIAPERLEARPRAALCVRCARGDR